MYIAYKNIQYIQYYSIHSLYDISMYKPSQQITFSNVNFQKKQSLKLMNHSNVKPLTYCLELILFSVSYIDSELFQIVHPVVRAICDSDTSRSALVLLGGDALELILGQLQQPLLRHAQHCLLCQQRSPYVGTEALRQVINL